MCFGDAQPVGDLLAGPGLQQKDCVSQLAEEHLGVSLEELVGVTEEEGSSSFHHPLQSSG